jgi:DNA-binding response OmpR family regulator
MRPPRGDGPAPAARILIVEDDAMIAMLEEDLLLQQGWQVVGPIATLAEALTLAKRIRLDGAVLDVNLHDELVFPLADLMALRGIPFVFVTGYGDQGRPDAHAERPMIRKPFDPATFSGSVAAALAIGEASL